MSFAIEISPDIINGPGVEELGLGEIEREKLHFYDRGKRTFRVLLAEDCPDTRLLLSHMLEHIGLEVVGVEDGEQCVEWCQFASTLGSEFDVVIVDIGLPLLDGYAAARQIRSNGFGGHIIATTAYPVPRDREEYIHSGCDFFISKSEIRPKLGQLLQNCLM